MTCSQRVAPGVGRPPLRRLDKIAGVAMPQQAFEPEPGGTPADLPASDRGPTTVAPARRVRRGLIRRDGTRWVVALDGQRVRVGDLIGMGYLAELLIRPGRPIPALTLAGLGAATREQAPHELLDDEARAAYTARAQELSIDLAEAEADNDLIRAETLRIEVDALVEQVASAAGLSGRPRTFTDDAERARTAVRKAIKRAVDVIDDANPAIADLLRTSVSTGATCVYTPPVTDPVVWTTTDLPAEGAPGLPADRSGPDPRDVDGAVPEARPPAPAGPDEPATIGARRRAASRRCFVGRHDEIELVRSALAADAPSPAVVFVHGPGGVGKTALLAAVAELAAAMDRRVVRLDMRSVEPSPAGFLAHFGAGLGREGEVATAEVVAGVGRLVLCVDAVDAAEPLDGWLREEFVAGLPADSFVVLAGRMPPSPEWLADPGWRELSCVVSLGNLSPADAGRYLDLQGVEPALHDQLVELTHGHPLALSLVVDVLEQQPSAARNGLDLVDAPDVVRMLMERFVGEIPDPRHEHALAVCAYARSTTEDLLRDALGGDDAGELLAWLRSRSFIEEGRFGLFPHDLARDVLDTDLRWRDRAGYEDLHERVRVHVVDRIRGAEGARRQRLVADLVYLQRRNPAVGSMIDWSRFGLVYADGLADGDREQLLAMTEHHQGRAQAKLVRHWIECQPGAFAVFRQRERSVLGFTAFLRLHEATPAQIAADPGAAAMWDHVTREWRPRPGDAVTAVRFFVDRAADQRIASQSWTGFVLAHALQVWTGDLAIDLIGAFHGLDAAPLFDHVDYARVPGAEFEAGGHHHHVFGHDWRESDVDAWHELIGHRGVDDASSST
jgi:hypothetical protein